ncbi:MAG: hypothetical protein ACTSU2_16425 [Promethearchaeota archaeon]
MDNFSSDDYDGGSAVFREIRAPVSVRKIKIKKYIKVVGIISIIIVGLVVFIPIIIRSKYTIADSTSEISKIDVISADNSSLYCQLDLKLHNPSPDGFTILNSSISLFYQNVTQAGLPEPSKHQVIANLHLNKSFIVNPNSYRTINIYFTLQKNDEAAENFIGMVLAKENHTILVQGVLNINSEEINSLSVNTKIRANDLFHYSVTDDKSTHLLINNNIKTIPVSAPDTTTDIELVMFYSNPFSYPMQINSLSFYLENETGKIWDHYTSNATINIGASSYYNISILADPTSDEITKTVSLLLNGTEDVFYLRNISAAFSIGPISFSIYRDVEFLKSNFSLSLKIIGYHLTSSSLKLDIEFDNGCGFEFNLTYIHIDIYIAGTNQLQKAIWLHDNVSIAPYDYAPIKKYSATVIYGVNVNFDSKYVNKVLIDKSRVDYIGYLSINSFQYDDDVPFESLNQTMIS